MDKEQGNRLIAEFMGAKEIKPIGYYKLDKAHYYPEQLFYHDSWSWVMEVVEKINEIDNQADKEFAKNREVFKQSNAVTIFNVSIFAPITLIWECVVQFIQWYNNLKNKQYGREI